MTQHERFDVIIVGAGPSGLMAATWLATTGIRTLLVEKQSCCTQQGRADGLESRTLEILDSFGIAEGIWAESNRTMEVCLWSASNKDGIHRDSVQGNSPSGLSRFQEVTLGQSRIEEYLLGFIQQSADVNIRWDTTPTRLTLLENKTKLYNDYAVDLQLNQHSGPGATTVQSKYLIGCDGAQSWVRKQCGLRLEGYNTNQQQWGVLDCIPTTNFPDIRKRCIIKSPAGNAMIIPREENLVRFYLELSPTAAAAFEKDRQPAVLLAILGKILKPYFLVTSHITWSTIYTVGQRLCPKFSIHERIFLAGDAVHTHSPKAGQGMNVSMQDTYNLGWKLASVIKGVASPDILRTYEEERLPVAQRLINFDRRMCQGLCSPLDAQSAGQGPETSECKFSHLKRALAEENSSASGLTVTYGPGLLVTAAGVSRSPSRSKCVAPCSKPDLATNIVLGRRLPDALVLCQSDSRPWHLQKQLTSQGQWHLLVFGGDIACPTQIARVRNLARSLSKPDSMLHHWPNSTARKAVGALVVYLVHSAPRLDIQTAQLPSIFRPFHEGTGYEYQRVLADNVGFHPGCGMAYKTYGIGNNGCLVLLRPDQHCAFIGALEDTDLLHRFLLGFTYLGCKRRAGHNFASSLPSSGQLHSVVPVLPGREN